jgi:hypothetical protein
MAEIEFSTTDNPHFQRIERAPYELGHLLQKMPESFSAVKPETSEDCLIAAAAAQHASNANQTVMNGLEALGQILFVASNNEQNEIEPQLLGSVNNQSLGAIAQASWTNAMKLRASLS